MQFSDLLAGRNLKFKILLVFSVILVIPLAFLMIVSLNRTSRVAQHDFNLRLGYAASLFRRALEDQLDSIKIKNKKVADFEFYTLATLEFPATDTVKLMDTELIRSDLDYLAIVNDRRHIFIDRGSPPVEVLDKIIPAMCHSPLNVNLYIIEDEPWIFSAAMITKIRSDEARHVVFAQRIPRDFADPLKRLTGAEFSLLFAGQKILTSQMDVYGKRRIGAQPEDPDKTCGSTLILGKSHFFVREVALPGKLSESIRLEIALPDSEYNLLGRSIRRDFIFFGFFGLLLALITGTILALNIAGPINQLAIKTSEIASGDLTIIHETDRKDEIGLLFRNFSEMITRLRAEKELKEQRMKELNTLFKISNAVNLFVDSEELLKFVLTHAIEVLEAERGSIMLLDDNTDELVVKVASGGRFRIASGTPVKLGHGVCGSVAREGAGKICNQGFKDPEFRNFGSILPVEDINSLLCSPLKFKDGIIGVINIVNKRNDGLFNESDLALLNLIASQAAVTIENNKLYELSITDGMTRLFVHRYFQARLSEEMLRARRYGLTLSLIMFDIDNFKKFNDSYGHQTGDQVLQKVATTIKETIRTGIDIPCRYGGEEMSVILPETRAEEAFQTAERIREKIAAITINHTSGILRVTTSIGIATYPSDGHDKESIIKAADRALYLSKARGKNCSTLAADLKNQC